MKNLSYVFRLFAFSLITLTINQSVSAQTQNVKFRIPIRTIDLSYERSLSSHGSLTLGLELTNHTRQYDIIWGANYNSPYGKSALLISGYRYYIGNKKSLNGLYVGAQAGFRFANAKIGYKDRIDGAMEATSATLGFDIGYQKRWKQFNLDMGFTNRRNFQLTGSDRIELNNGKTKEVPSFIDGDQVLPYIRFGFAF